MYAVRLAPKALDDLRSIANYIAQDNPARAMTFIDEIQHKAKAFLATAPNGGSLYKYKTRYFPVGNYVVLYEVNEPAKQVDVLHVVSARTDWKK